MAEFVRYSIDLPKEQHVYLMALAQMSNTNMKDIVCNYLPMPKLKINETFKDNWSSIVEETMLELDPMLKRLADR